MSCLFSPNQTITGDLQWWQVSQALLLNRTCGQTYIRPDVGGAIMPWIFTLFQLLIHLPVIVVRIASWEDVQTLSIFLAAINVALVSQSYSSTDLTAETVLVWSPITLAIDAGAMLQLFILVRGQHNDWRKEFMEWKRQPRQKRGTDTLAAPVKTDHGLPIHNRQPPLEMNNITMAPGDGETPAAAALAIPMTSVAASTHLAYPSHLPILTPSATSTLSATSTPSAATAPLAASTPLATSTTSAPPPVKATSSSTPTPCSCQKVPKSDEIIPKPLFVAFVVVASSLLFIAIVALQVWGLIAAFQGSGIDSIEASWCSPLFGFESTAQLDLNCNFRAISSSARRGIGCIRLPGKRQLTWLLVTKICILLGLMIEVFDFLILWKKKDEDTWWILHIQRPWCTMIIGSFILIVALAFGARDAYELPAGISGKTFVIFGGDQPNICTGELTPAGLRGQFLGWLDGILQGWKSTYFGLNNKA